MKNRNQFLLAGIRFLASSVFVALLGMGVGNTMKANQTKVIKKNLTVVSQTEMMKMDAKLRNHRFGNVEKTLRYTYMIGPRKLNLNPLEYTMNIENVNRRRNEEPNVKYYQKLPKVINKKVFHPPRDGSISQDTS